MSLARFVDRYGETTYRDVDVFGHPTYAVLVLPPSPPWRFDAGDAVPPTLRAHEVIYKREWLFVLEGPLVTPIRCAANPHEFYADVVYRETCSCPGVRRTGCPCARCHGTGWYPANSTEDGDYDEAYCDCFAGTCLRARDSGGPPPQQGA